jgi:hypothetical protein
MAPIAATREVYMSEKANTISPGMMPHADRQYAIAF